MINYYKFKLESNKENLKIEFGKLVGEKQGNFRHLGSRCVEFKSIISRYQFFSTRKQKVPSIFRSKFKSKKIP